MSSGADPVLGFVRQRSVAGTSRAQAAQPHRPDRHRAGGALRLSVARRRAAQQGHRLHRGGARRLRPARPVAAARRGHRRAGLRRRQAFREFATDLERYAFLRDLQDTNETLFYALLASNIEELLPIVYTPTVGAGCQLFSRLFRKPRGLFLSFPHRDAHPADSRQPALRQDRGHRRHRRRAHPGPGRPGRRRHGHPDRQARALHRPAAASHPATDAADAARCRHRQRRPSRRSALYRLAPRARARPRTTTISSRNSSPRSTERWPHVLLQWEDFAKANATRLLERYRDRLCTFNDDIQGTAAVATGTLLAAIDVTGVPLTEQRIAILGAGSAGCGIARLLYAAMVDAGLDAKDGGAALLSWSIATACWSRAWTHRRSSSPSCRPREAVADWSVGRSDRVALLDVMRQRPADGADRRLRPGRRLLRAGRARHGQAQRAAGHLPAVQPDVARRSDARRHRALERGPRHHRRRQPVPAAQAQRPPVQGRPDQQLLHLSGRRPRRDGGAGAAHHRHHVHGGGQGAGGAVAGSATATPICCRRSRRCARLPSPSPSPSANRRTRKA